MTITDPVTLYREKSTVHRFGSQSRGDSVLEVRSNRLTMLLRSPDRTSQVVIRGQNIPATLRLASLVIDQHDHNPTLFSDQSYIHLSWREMWQNRQSSYEKRFIPEEWVSLHHDGQPIFSTTPSSVIDEIERLARGGDLSRDVIRTASAEFVDQADDAVVEHESQTAAVFTPFKDYLRVAVLERRGGKTGSFAMSAHHPPKPAKPVPMAGFVNICADITEALAFKVFLDKIKAMLDQGRPHGSIPPQQVEAAIGRKRDLMQFIVAYERANKVTYRPERPVFF